MRTKKSSKKITYHNKFTLSINFCVLNTNSLLGAPSGKLVAAEFICDKICRQSCWNFNKISCYPLLKYAFNKQRQFREISRKKIIYNIIMSVWRMKHILNLALNIDTMRHGNDCYMHCHFINDNFASYDFTCEIS